MRVIRTDVAIIGSGAAGLYAAIRAAEAGAEVLVIDKGLIAKSGSTVSAASMAAVGPWHSPGDSQEAHFQDTMAGGYWINCQRLVRLLVERVSERIKELEGWGLSLDREEDGSYFVDGRAGHSYRRNLACSGDRIGLRISKTLWRKALQMGVSTRSDLWVTSLLTRDGEVVGVMAIDARSGELVTVKAGATVLTTGGIGQLYSMTTNGFQMTGDGLAMALRAGAVLKDMEFVQFIPASLVYPESARGYPVGLLEHSKFLNGDLERFMARYDPERMERATRDVNSRAIYSEIRAGRGTEHRGVFLDAREVPEKLFRNFQHERKFCLEAGLDLKKEMVEVAPAAHFLMGGIEIDGVCETSRPGLYAAGEVTSGVNGANRLSGNSLADTLVFGAIAGREAAAHGLGRDPLEIDAEQVEAEREWLSGLLTERNPGIRPHEAKAAIQRVMWEKAGVIRSQASLTDALDELANIEEQLTRVAIHPSHMYFNYEFGSYLEAKNMVLVARAIVASALAREESRGAHFREDYAEQDDQLWLKSTAIRLEGGRLQICSHPRAFEG